MSVVFKDMTLMGHSTQSIARWVHQRSFSLFPGTCVLCRDSTYRDIDLCTACEGDLPWINHPCTYCSEEMPVSDGVCTTCLHKRPQYSAALCGFRYQFPIDALNHQFKNHRNFAAGITLTQLLADKYVATLRRFDIKDTLVTPVPLNPKKKISRLQSIGVDRSRNFPSSEHTTRSNLGRQGQKYR